MACGYRQQPLRNGMKSNADHSTPVRESHLRSIVKAASWRTTGTIDTFILGYFFTGSVKLAGSIATTEVITKLGLFYLHERAWDRFRWGRSAKQKSSAHTYPTVAEATA
jgi:uncharacterized membrane protein